MKQPNNVVMRKEWQEMIGREFRHFKGNLYRIEGFAKDSETLEQMVVYRALGREIWYNMQKRKVMK